MAAKRSKPKATRRSSPRRTRRPADTLTMLRADHENVSAMFDRFERTRKESVKQDLAERICTELTIHATIEEEIFYPAVRELIDDDDLMAEATVEHASVKNLIAQIEAASPDDEMFNAQVTVLGEYVKHHVKEEQQEMFPKVRKTDLDLKALGDQIRQRKQELI